MRHRQALDSVCWSPQSFVLRRPSRLHPIFAADGRRSDCEGDSPCFLFVSPPPSSTVHDPISWLDYSTDHGYNLKKVLCLSLHIKIVLHVCHSIQSSQCAWAGLAPLLGEIKLPFAFSRAADWSIVVCLFRFIISESANTGIGRSISRWNTSVNLIW